jgi:hypothetical protein
MRTAYDRVSRILRPALLATAFGVAVLMALNAIVDLAHATPHIGDIVSFSASNQQPGGDAARLIVHRQNQFGCVLDLNILRQSGGSLIVESEIAESAGSFLVHWAGERTTADTGNCGDNADLILNARDLDILALSAGGYGVDSDRRLVFTTASGT